MGRYVWPILSIALVTWSWLMTSAPAAPIGTAQNRDNFSSDVNTTEISPTWATTDAGVRPVSLNETNQTRTTVDDEEGTSVTTQSNAVRHTNSDDVKHFTRRPDATAPSRQNASSVSDSKSQNFTRQGNSSDEQEVSKNILDSKNYTWDEIYAEAFNRNRNQTSETKGNPTILQSKNTSNSETSTYNSTNVSNHTTADNAKFRKDQFLIPENMTERIKETPQNLSSSNVTTTNMSEETITMKSDSGSSNSHPEDTSEKTSQEETELNLRVLEAAKNVAETASSEQESGRGNSSDVISPLADVTGRPNVTAVTSDNSTRMTSNNVTTAHPVLGVAGTAHLGLLVKHLTGFVHNVWVGQPSGKTPGPSNEDLLDDGPFGSVLMRERKYLISVLIPIGVGITGAMLIIVMAYATRMCGRRDQLEESPPRMIFNPGMRRRSPDRFPLHESSDEEF